jgi:choice-of-anchor B domain-containing protein
MRKIFTFLFILFCFQALAQYSSQNISLFKNVNPFQGSTSIIKSKYSSVFGYADTVKKKEYAILGSAAGAYFIDVTNPYYATVLDFVAGRRDKCIWREYATYKNYLYAISDDQEENSLQIIDLSYLPDSVHVVYDSDTLSYHSHTAFVDGDKLYLGSVTRRNKPSYSMAVYSLENPENPKFLRGLNQDYPLIGHVHDMFVRNDTVFASCGDQGLYVYRFNILASTPNFELLGSLTNYPDQGYNHSTTLSPDGKTLVMCDEVGPGLAVKVLDVSDLSDIKVLSKFKSNNGATPHNPYMVGKDKVVIATYLDGVQVYDLSNPAAPTRLEYFDTFPENGTRYPNDSVYNGNWGAYVGLPSGTLLVSDMKRGLFVLNSNSITKTKFPAPPVVEEKKETISPNPFLLALKISSIQPINEIEIRNSMGKLLLNEKYSENTTLVQLDNLSHLSVGMYFVKVRTQESTQVYKVIKGN